MYQIVSGLSVIVLVPWKGTEFAVSDGPSFRLYLLWGPHAECALLVLFKTFLYNCEEGPDNQSSD
jgi:hypothetical protein